MANKFIGYISFAANLLNPHVFFKTLFFNFYHLPFMQAIKFPIWLYKAKLYDCFSGKVVINSKEIRPGMIRLGFMGDTCIPTTAFKSGIRENLFSMGDV